MTEDGYADLGITNTIDNVNDYFNDYINETMIEKNELRVIFDEKAFIKKNDKKLRPFLKQFKQTSLFQSYVNDLIEECKLFPLPSQLN